MQCCYEGQIRLLCFSVKNFRWMKIFLEMTPAGLKVFLSNHSTLSTNTNEFFDISSKLDSTNMCHSCNALTGWRSAGARESSARQTLRSYHHHSLQPTCSCIMLCQSNWNTRQYCDAAWAHAVIVNSPTPKWPLRHNDYISYISGQILESTRVMCRDSQNLLFIWKV